MQPGIADAVSRIDLRNFTHVGGGERGRHNRAERFPRGGERSRFRDRSARIRFGYVLGDRWQRECCDPGDLDGFLLRCERDVRHHGQSAARWFERRLGQPQHDCQRPVGLWHCHSDGSSG